MYIVHQLSDIQPKRGQNPSFGHNDFEALRKNFNYFSLMTYDYSNAKYVSYSDLLINVSETIENPIISHHVYIALLICTYTTLHMYIFTLHDIHYTTYVQYITYIIFLIQAYI